MADKSKGNFPVLGVGIVVVVILIVAAYFLTSGNGSAANNGPSCAVSADWICQGASVSNGNLSFTLGQTLGSDIYNIGVACVATGSPAPTIVYISSSGSATSVAAAPGSTLLNATPLSIPSGSTASVSGVKCAGAQSGATYAIWVNYTLGSGTPSTLGGGTTVSPGGSNYMVSAQVGNFTA